MGSSFTGNVAGFGLRPLSVDQVRERTAAGSLPDWREY
jgi:hypothetical protein